MKYFKNKETKKFLGFFMALAMVVSMMPGVANAASTSLPVAEVINDITVKTDKGISVTTSDALDVSAVVEAVTSSAVSGCVVTVTVKAKKGYAITGEAVTIEAAINGDKCEIKNEAPKGAASPKYVAERTFKEETPKTIKVELTGKLTVMKVKIDNSNNGSTTAPTATAAPTATVAPTASVAPSASAAPTASVAPSASAAPTASVAPTESATPTVAPTKAPAKTVKAGTKKTVNGAKYKVTKGNKVTYTAPSKKTAKVTIPATVKINGVTCKVTTIDKGAFKGNTKIKTVSLGKNITKIEANAFKGCKNLKTITIKSTSLTKKNVAKTAFKGINKKATFKVPAKKVKAYKTVVKYAGAPKTVKVTK